MPPAAVSKVKVSVLIATGTLGGTKATAVDSMATRTLNMIAGLPEPHTCTP